MRRSFRRSPEDEEPGEVFAGARPVLSVAEVTRAIREILESSFPGILVRGEITNLSRPQSGHVYFSLADDAGAGASRFSSAQLQCVMWRSSAARLRVRLENGLKVIACGRIGVYEPRGTYQLVAESVEAAGMGDLQRRFEELKEKLRKEGLFEPERKRPLPFLPRRIAIVTSPSGAALQDVLRVLYQRHPRAWVRIVPVRVQGEGAAEEIAGAVRALQAGGGQADVILLTRGGGSLEDLWAFNDEGLARAVAASGIPTVSAVGHEVDFSITDFVADLRAQTPTRAAELIVPDVVELEESLRLLERRLRVGLDRGRERREADLRRLLRSRYLRDPRVLVDELIERCDDLGEELRIRLYNLWRRWEDATSGALARLEALSPLRVLERGYSLVLDGEDRVVTDAAAIRMGQVLRVLLARGRALVEVRETEPGGARGGEGAGDSKT